MVRPSRTEPPDPLVDRDRPVERDVAVDRDRPVDRAPGGAPVWSRAADELEDDDPGDDGPIGDEAAAARRPVSLAGLSVAGITRRRSAFALGALVTLWVVLVFARQVGDASAAMARADEIRTANAALTTGVAALQAEVRLIRQQSFIEQQARGYGLGTPQERPFALAPGASPVPSNAPGSAALRLGASPEARSPLETWLSLLFGPAPR